MASMDKHICEGWTVGDFVKELAPLFQMIMNGQSWVEPFKNRKELERWCADNQPYYKKPIREVVDHFAKLANIK
jgi:hypothetical protein